MSMSNDTAPGALQTRADEWVIEPRGRKFVSRVREVWVYRRLFIYFGKRAIVDGDDVLSSAMFDDDGPTRAPALGAFRQRETTQPLPVASKASFDGAVN